MNYKALIYLLFFTIVIGAAPHVQAMELCTFDKFPRIQVIPGTDDVVYDYTKSKDELRGFQIDTISPYDPNAHTEVGGLTSGRIKSSAKMQFQIKKYPALNKTCLAFDKIRVDIWIDQTVFVAREHKKGSCSFNAVRDHEMKHVRTDREVINKYARMIGNALADEVRKQWIYGPVPASQAKMMQSVMQERINIILERHYSKMDVERNKRQQAIDSYQEYQRVARQCDGTRGASSHSGHAYGHRHR